MFFIIVLIGIATAIFLVFKKEQKQDTQSNKLSYKKKNNNPWRDATEPLKRPPLKENSEHQPPTPEPLTEKPNEQSKKPQPLGYRKHRYILTKAERSFYGVIKQATEENYEIFIKIRIADILKPNIGNRSEWQTAFNKIAHKHFDFVICKKKTLQIIAVIELNDKSHDEPDREKRDKFVREACKSAGMPIIFITAKNGYNIEKTRQLITLIEKSKT